VIDLLTHVYILSFRFRSLVDTYTKINIWLYKGQM
jgi:hypothetical protein